MMKMSPCRVNNGDNTNIRAVTDIVVDDELEVGDVDQSQTALLHAQSVPVNPNLEDEVGALRHFQVSWLPAL